MKYSFQTTFIFKPFFPWQSPVIYVWLLFMFASQGCGALLLSDRRLQPLPTNIFPCNPSTTSTARLRLQIEKEQRKTQTWDAIRRRFACARRELATDALRLKQGEQRVVIMPPPKQLVGCQPECLLWTAIVRAWMCIAEGPPAGQMIQGSLISCGDPVNTQARVLTFRRGRMRACSRKRKLYASSSTNCGWWMECRKFWDTWAKLRMNFRNAIRRAKPRSRANRSRSDRCDVHLKWHLGDCGDPDCCAFVGLFVWAYGCVCTYIFIDLLC